MNTALAKFLSIAATVITIGTFVFFIAYNMIGGESEEYRTNITGQSDNLPTAGTTTNTP